VGQHLGTQKGGDSSTAARRLNLRRFQRLHRGSATYRKGRNVNPFRVFVLADVLKVAP